MKSTSEPDSPALEVKRSIEAVYRSQSRRVFATLIRLLGDFDLAEEALSEAFLAALDQWPRDGIPDNPRAWLVSAGRFKGIDAIRRRARFDKSLTAIADAMEEDAEATDEFAPDRIDQAIADDPLRLIFTCCHPALAEEARVALTLREVCGLSTEEVARAFLTTVPTMAQRIVRAKAKIRDAAIPYRVPDAADLPERLDTALQVVYLVFNEGYFASAGDSLVRADLTGEAIRLGRLLVELLPDAETMGLLALMLLTEARRPARTTPAGEPVLLDQQDRSLWDQALIREGLDWHQRAMATRRIGPYTLQAGIAAEHARATSPEATDWRRIVGIYDVLMQAAPSPVVELNRAAAVAMHDGAEAALTLVDVILERGDLPRYGVAYATRADLCRRLGRIDEARTAYQQALALSAQEPERRFLTARLQELGDSTATPVDSGAPGTISS